MGGELMFYWLIYNTTTGAIGTHSSTHSPAITTTTNGESTTSFDTSLLNGMSLIGWYDDASNPMNPDEQAAYNTPQAYLYQNGAFVSNSAWPAQQLVQAKQTQSAALESAMNTTLGGGFTSKSTGHTYKTDAKGQADFIEALKFFELSPSTTSVKFLTLDAGWTDHTSQQLQQAFVDGGLWKQAQYTQLTSLVAKVETATTVADVQAITWTEATY